MLQPRQRLGDFEVVRLLGKGGMGEVYEALQTNPQRHVALKVLSPWLAENEGALERFWREAAVPAKLDHPNIVRIISTGKSENIAYYAMQLVRGISLADLVGSVDESQLPPQSTTDPNRGDQTTIEPMPAWSKPESGSASPPIVDEYRRDRFKTAAHIGVQAARALSAAHEQGFLHRDIKPSNLMIDHHNQLYLVDFGLTRALTGDSNISRSGIIVGTPWYMSPEQARGDPLDERSDIFSLGVTLYQLASGGRGPYTASRVDADAVLRQVRDGSSVPLQKVAPRVPAVLDAIIQRSIEPQPRRRYQTMQELAEDLQSYLDPSSATRTWQSRAPRRAKLPTLVYFLAVVAAILVGGLGVGGYYYFNALRATANIVPGPGDPPLPPPKWKVPRPVRVREPLLRDDNKPVESERLTGDGKVAALPAMLTLTSTDLLMPTTLALAHVPKQWFEFSVEVKPADFANSKANNVGVFFGWQENLDDPQSRRRFFVAQLDRRPVLKDMHGRLTLGTATLDEGEGALFDFFRPLPGEKAWIPLAAPVPEGNPWYTVVVRVQNHKIRVSVDKASSQEIDVPWLQDKDSFVRPFTLEPRGLLGIWVRNGHGSFRNATLLALPGEGDE